MITVPASFTIDEATFEKFVIRLGYQESVEDKTTGEMIENTESKIEYAQRIFKQDAVMPWLLQFVYQDIDVAVNNEREQARKNQKEAAYKAIESAVIVG